MPDEETGTDLYKGKWYHCFLKCALALEAKRIASRKQNFSYHEG